MNNVKDLILGIDPSTTNVGWCFLTTDGEYCNSGHVSLGDLERTHCPPWRSCVTPMPDEDEKGEAWDRLWAFAMWMETDMLVVHHDMDTIQSVLVVAVEETVGFHGNLDTERKMGASMGVVYAGAARKGIGVIRF